MPTDDRIRMEWTRLHTALLIASISMIVGGFGYSFDKFASINASVHGTRASIDGMTAQILVMTTRMAELTEWRVKTEGNRWTAEQHNEYAQAQADRDLLVWREIAGIRESLAQKPPAELIEKIARMEGDIVTIKDTLADIKKRLP